MSAAAGWFRRFLLPGFAFKAVVIGGGYATGRELAEFFLPAGPIGGIAGMALAMLVWSVVCAATFAFAQATQAFDYRRFFQALLGPGWVVYEAAYLAFLVLVLAVFGAAAGAIGEAMLGWPRIAGTLALVAGVAGFVAFGNDAVERVFQWVTFFLYAVYATFVVLALSTFGDRVAANFALPAASDGWATGGLTYAGYNVVGAVIILPALRHLTSRRDAIVAGLAAGPLAMLPAMLFFVCMIAFWPAVGAETLPSDFLLQRLNLPWFHALFQLMIFLALLESGCGIVHAINERVASSFASRGRTLAAPARLGVAMLLLAGSIFLADRYGMVALIARGYRFLALVFLVVYVLPVLTVGVWRLVDGGAQSKLSANS